MVGLSFRFETKSPGTNDIARNEMKVIPKINGIMLSRRRIRKRDILFQWTCNRAREMVPLIPMPRPRLEITRYQRPYFRRARDGECSIGLELHPLRFVQPPNRRLIVFKRVLPR